MSALDGRIRTIAREEAAAALDGAPAGAQGPDRVAELEQQLAELTARVEELEKTPAPVVKRTARKSEPTE